MIVPYAAFGANSKKLETKRFQKSKKNLPKTIEILKKPMV